MIFVEVVRIKWRYVVKPRQNRIGRLLGGALMNIFAPVFFVVVAAVLGFRALCLLCRCSTT
jgi:hypothetical protein